MWDLEKYNKEKFFLKNGQICVSALLEYIYSRLHHWMIPSNHLTDILSYVAMVIIIVYLTEMLNLMLFLRLNVFAIWELMVIKSCTTCDSHG